MVDTLRGVSLVLFCSLLTVHLEHVLATCAVLGGFHSYCI